MHEIFEELEECQNKLRDIQSNIKELLIMDSVLEAKCLVEVEHFKVLKKLIPENELWTAMRNLIKDSVEQKQGEIRTIGEKLACIARTELFEEEGSDV